MSGEKQARARLSRAALAALEREIEQNRASARMLTRAANVVGRAELQAHELEEFQERGAELSTAFQEKVKAFTHALDAARGARAAVQARLDEIQDLRGRPLDLLPAPERVAELRRELGQKTRALGPVAKELEAQLSVLADSLRDERYFETYRTTLEDRRRRQALAGIREELTAALHPAAACSLQWVAERAGLLRQRLDELLGPGTVVTEEDVEDCRGRLADLVREAQQAERRHEEHRALFARVDAAFRHADFERDTGADEPRPTETIEARYVRRQADSRSSVDCRVHADGRLELHMRGRSTERDRLVGPDQHCDERLEAVIAEAKALGVEISDVWWRGPGGGWEEMALPGVVQEKRRRMRRAPRSLEAPS